MGWVVALVGKGWNDGVLLVECFRSFSGSFSVSFLVFGMFAASVRHPSSTRNGV